MSPIWWSPQGHFIETVWFLHKLYGLWQTKWGQMIVLPQNQSTAARLWHDDITSTWHHHARMLCCKITVDWEPYSWQISEAKQSQPCIGWETTKNPHTEIINSEQPLLISSLKNLEGSPEISCDSMASTTSTKWCPGYWLRAQTYILNFHWKGFKDTAA